MTTVPRTTRLRSAAVLGLTTATLTLGLAAPAAAAPNAPSGVTAVPGNRAATISWSAVPGATGYTVESTPGSLTRAVGGSQTSVVLDGLTNGTAYSFRVVTRDGSGFSPASGASPVVVPATVPDPPTQVAAVPGDTSAEVSWTPPTSDGGRVLTGYTVLSSPEGLSRTTGPGATSVAMTGLTNGVTYTFTVAANNERGSSTPSSPSGAVVPAQGGTVDPGTGAGPGGGGTVVPGTGTGGGTGGSTGDSTGGGTPDGGPSGPGPQPDAPAPASPSASPVASASPSASASASATPSRAAPSGSGFTSLPSPVRVLDSRNGTGTGPGLKTGAVLLDLSAKVPAGATAAVLNVTVTNPVRAGFVVVHPDGSARPGTSNVNVTAGQTQANEVVTGLSAARKVVVHLDSTSAHVVADLVGWFAPGSGGRVDVRTPSRVLDTRTTRTPRRSGEIVLDLADRLPAGATDVVLNVTVTGADRRGFLVAHPTGTSRPGTSNVNVDRGQTQANEVVTRLGTGANAGKVSLFVDGASAGVVADLVAVVGPADGQGLTVTAPTRVLDSRSGTGVSPGRRAGVVELRLPASVPSDARAVVLNVTVTGASASGFVAVYGGTTHPGTSNVNFRAGATQANEVLVAVGPDRTVRLLVGGGGAPQAHLVADLVAVLG